MSEEKIKKTRTKKTTAPKKPKTLKEPSPVKEKTEKPKRVIKRAPKKVNLMVRNISTDKEAVDTIKKTGDKSNLVVDKTKLKESKVLKSRRVGNKAKSDAFEIDTEPFTVKARVIKERPEKEKRLLMWIGVTFFMSLFSIFWFYSTKESIERSRLEWKDSGAEESWDKMAENVSKQIQEMKGGIESVKNFSQNASSTLAEQKNNALFQAGASTSNQVIDEEILGDIRRDLEIQSGAVKPAPGEFYFIIPENERQAILRYAEEVELGTELAQLRKDLGEADYSEEIKDNRGVFVSNVLNYNLKIFKKGELNEKLDEFISFEFDQDGRLTRVNKHLE
jgi:hypothetical protein